MLLHANQSLRQEMIKPTKWTLQTVWFVRFRFITHFENVTANVGIHFHFVKMLGYWPSF